MLNINLTSLEFERSLNNNPNAVLLDVRTKEEYLAERLPDAILIDFYSSDFIEKINKLDKSKTYFIYCRSGSRSLQTCLYMLNEGFQEVYNLGYGIINWHGKTIKGYE